jgi:hypothetical protein
MALRPFLVAILAALPWPAPGAQTSIWIDPTYGRNQPSAGSSAMPFRTLTYAVSQLPAGIAVTFHLRPGSYGPASGEVYPVMLPPLCHLMPDRTMTRPDDGAVSFAASATGQPTLSLDARIGPAAVVLEGLEFDPGPAAAFVVSANGATAHVTIVLTHCSIGSAAGLAAAATQQAFLDLQVTDCELRCAARPLEVRTATGAIALLQLDRSVFEAGEPDGLLLSADTGLVTAALRACRVRGAARRGIHALTERSGVVATRIEACLLHDIGIGQSGNDVGAVVDSPGPTGTTPAHVIVNSLFDNNAADVANPTSGGYTFGINLVQQSSLAGLGANRLGQATFVDPATEDFRLAPASIGIDAGNSADATLFTDLDGDPRMTLTSVNPDLGADEYYDHYCYATAPPRLGRQLVLRTTTLPVVPFGMVAATDRVRGSFGAGLVHLAGTLVPTAQIGTTSARGIGEMILTMPGDPALLGIEVWWQVVVATPPWLGANAWRTVVRGA